MTTTEPYTGLLEEAMSEPIPDLSDDLIAINGLPAAGQYKAASVHIRELTGADEEAVARSKTTTGLLRLLLERCVLSIGGGPKPTADDLDNLLIGDRDSILLGIWRATYGPEYETAVICPQCAATTEMAFDLNTDIKVRKLEDPTVVRTVELRRPGTYAKLRLVAVADQEAAVLVDGRTIPEMNTVTLARVVSELNGSPSLGEQTLRNLNSGDRQKLAKYLNDTAPGPRLGEVKAECPKCGRESDVVLNLASMFL